MMVSTIKVALLDMAATTVDDFVQKEGMQGKLPLVLAAYGSAFEKAGISMSFDELNACRGRNKLEVFQEKVIKYRTDLNPEEQNNLARALHDDEFVPALLANVPYLTEISGTSETFSFLKNNGIYVATGSGFPQVVTDAINEQLGWKAKGLVDYGTCGEAVGGGRPKPNMINATLIAAGLLPEGIDKSKKQEGFNYSILLKVGDTLEDIHEGKGVGALTVAVSSGTQSIETLVKAEPKVLLPSVAALPLYLKKHGYLE
ncbi:MAG: hypothetical protein AABX31_00435 [Nanoarchaeota archaeon]